MRKIFCILSGILLSVFLTYIPCYTNDFVDSFKEAEVLAKNGDYPAAITVFTNLLDKYPDFHEVNYRIGELYFRMDKPAEAVPYLKRAIELDNSSFMPHYLLAECLIRTGDLQEAYEIEQKALKIGKFHTAVTHNGLSSIYELQGTYDKAIEETIKATQLYPTTADNYRLATLYFKTGNYEKVIDSLKNEDRLEQLFPDIHYMKAISFLRMDKKDQAIQEYEKLKILSPDLADKLSSEFSQSE